jgi:glycerol-3-phosphate O-acyltransferase
VVENRGAVDKESVMALFKVWWPLLSNELILDASESYYKIKVERSLEFMIARGLLHLDASKSYKTPPPHSDAYVQFNVLSNLHRPLLRRCGLSTLVLEMLSKKNALVTVEELKKRSEVFVKKMSLLLGAFDMELTRAGVFESILRFYKSCGLLVPRENDQYAVDSEILSLFLTSCPSLLTQSEVEGIRRAKLESARLEQGAAESTPQDSPSQSS